MNKKYQKVRPAELDVDQDMLNQLPVRGELNIEALVFRQIERTHQAAVQDESLFASNVRLLLNMLPSPKKVEIVNTSEEYTSTVQRYQYKYFCGVPLGTPQEPVNGSPALVEEEIIDWHKLLEMILEAFERAGVTWKTESYTIEAGKVDEVGKIIAPTPKFGKRVVEEPEKAERIKRCGICAERVTLGTGTNFDGMLVHKACKEAKLSETP